MTHVRPMSHSTPPITIDLCALEDAGACKKHLDKARNLLAGEGTVVDITRENILDAAAAGIDLDWFIEEMESGHNWFVCDDETRDHITMRSDAIWAAARYLGKGYLCGEVGSAGSCQSCLA